MRSVDRSQIDGLLAYIKFNGRVCPVPRKWGKLSNLLGQIAYEKSQSEGTKMEKPPVSLVLDGWWFSTISGKAKRLHTQVMWAYERGGLDAIDHFLRNLDEEDWAHEDDLRLSHPY
jgi:hypothetical protein